MILMNKAPTVPKDASRIFVFTERGGGCGEDIFCMIGGAIVAM
jgi:hypothetical protein